MKDWQEGYALAWNRMRILYLLQNRVYRCKDMRLGGNIAKRGFTSWRIKWELPKKDGKRQRGMETIRGTREEARIKLNKRIMQSGHPNQRATWAEK